MDGSRLDETPVIAPERAATAVGCAPASTRKPYGTPRLAVYGRVPACTLDSDSPQEDRSDRNLKEGFAPVDPRVILARVAALPIETWSYKGETARHLGPMAQDFAAAFALGADDRHIFPLDAGGVALAAIQGLHTLVRAQDARLRALEAELAALRAEVAVHDAVPVA